MIAPQLPWKGLGQRPVKQEEHVKAARRRQPVRSGVMAHLEMRNGRRSSIGHDADPPYEESGGSTCRESTLPHLLVVDLPGPVHLPILIAPAMLVTDLQGPQSTV